MKELREKEMREHLGAAEFDLDRCMSCGLCMDTCATYAVTGRSSSSPRGRMRLMMNLLQGTVDLDHKVPYTNVTVRHELETCLGCLACDTSCPADIQHTEMFDRVKRMIQQQDPEAKGQVNDFLRDMPVDNPKRLRLLMRMLYFAQRLGAIWLVRNTPLRKLLPPRKRDMVKLLAKRIPYQPSSRVLSGPRPAVGPTKMRVGVFLGCINDHMFAEVNLAMVRVLQRLGAEVVVLNNETCCGAVHSHMGEVGIARDMAIQNCARFAEVDVDAIAVSAAGCGLHMKSYAHLYPEDPAVKRLGPKFKDIHEVLWSLLEKNPSCADEWVWPRRGESYTYHEACHLVHGQRISAVPLKLLQRIKGLNHTPLKDAMTCCGSAGTYNIFQPELAQQIQKLKIANIVETKADIVAVGNSGCALQIISGLADAGKRRIKCLHPVEMINMSWCQS